MDHEHHEHTHETADDRGNRTATLLTGVGLGAALMYFLDPGRGARRRHVVRDKGMSALRSAGEEIRDRAADLRNRARGAAHEMRGRRTDEAVSDEQLVARVRSELGHHVDQMGGIEVRAQQGTIILSGAVARDDLDDVLEAARQVPGVHTVDDRLEVRSGTRA